MSSTRRHSVFRPCIDLHNGLVKQIVGGTLSDVTPSELKTNFVSSKTAGEFARLYKEHNLRGGHVIKLGPGNDAAAEEALTEWNNGLHIGGGITQDNCQQWIDAGAEKVIVTSYLFPSGQFSLERLQGISAAVGKERLVVDVSCRRRNDKWIIAMNKWQDMTDMENLLTYSPNTADISDLDLVDRLSQGRVDLTFGSALDIFGGSLVRFDDLVEYNRKYQSL
ncbi:1-(5-phosphoribosyl)-5-[(5-phosphoribosylamino)methylideneamino] imidazole-4-carboxamide isomerase; AltName: Full=5-proFAR isomerase; AltName: Full=Phosphoribosylformimino-5-aminoimidazole carboxamide ribotide isomerase [Serendipita indica DSM 11827]|nr:1-(5-phosphoribosyl)-5-[(5-phosphoribosylamino)methylideneamino] imidazole-4-carboxamide isomerase; AltName: Full=5-proFAR isomerase; AltName: Full=Phosphoribosylformimino-5-aminoimidazole carboxamide ribotide isomerase [Serendipita indica DSM 11827]